jgi:hypothetical protein
MAEAYPGPLSGREDVFDQEAFDTDDEPAGQHTAELPLELAAPVTEPADEQVAEQVAAPAPMATRRGRAQKPTMPSWDDILMGVRRKTD